MNLTAKEAKLVKRLRKYDRQWRFTRWVLVVGGVFLIGIWAWMLHYVSASSAAIRDKELEVLVRALAYPKVLFGMIIGALMIAFALRDWYGSATRTLLLRLLEEHQVEPGAAPQVAPTSHPSHSGAPGVPPP